ncbi:MAG: hypothetical protein LBH46_02775, partial [Rickettsiales bacterium]|nr:hypothetical protein [Rickettsiales bacterium]
IDDEVTARESGDDITLSSANTYTDEQIAAAELSKQIWLPAVQTLADLEAITPPSPDITNYLCRVINDDVSKDNNGTYQWIAGATEWTYFSDNLDFVDEEELATALATKQNTLNRTIQINLASTSSATDTGGNITVGATGILSQASGGTGNTSGQSASCSGNSATATKLQTARTIGGVSFDGTANINLPGVNQAGNQNTTGTSSGFNTAKTTSSANLAVGTKISLGNGTLTVTGAQFGWTGTSGQLNEHPMFVIITATGWNGSASWAGFLSASINGNRGVYEMFSTQGGFGKISVDYNDGVGNASNWTITNPGNGSTGIMSFSAYGGNSHTHTVQ